MQINIPKWKITLFLKLHHATDVKENSSQSMLLQISGYFFPLKTGCLNSLIRIYDFLLSLLHFSCSIFLIKKKILEIFLSLGSNIILFDTAWLEQAILYLQISWWWVFFFLSQTTSTTATRTQSNLCLYWNSLSKSMLCLKINSLKWSVLQALRNRSAQFIP